MTAENELPGLFVVGTDTGVGKTRIASAIARSLTKARHKVGVLKPVATGAVRDGNDWQVDDADQLIQAIGQPLPTDRACPIALADPLAPPVAARQAGAILLMGEVERRTTRCIDAWREAGADLMVVEGVGGFLCPIAEGATVADLAVTLDYPLVLVARRGLGTINHTLLTIEAALRRGLRIAGLILNGSEPTSSPLAEQTNPFELARWLGAIPILADLPHDADEFMTVVMDGLDWYNRASRPRLPFPRI